MDFIPVIIRSLCYINALVLKFYRLPFFYLLDPSKYPLAITLVLLKAALISEDSLAEERLHKFPQAVRKLEASVIMGEETDDKDKNESGQDEEKEKDNKLEM